MEKQLNLYLLTPKEVMGYGCWDGMVVAATSVEEALSFHPSSDSLAESLLHTRPISLVSKYEEGDATWVQPEAVCIGVANEAITAPMVILSSSTGG